jgi:hypothetical protein
MIGHLALGIGQSQDVYSLQISQTITSISVWPCRLQCSDACKLSITMCKADAAAVKISELQKRVYILRTQYNILIKVPITASIPHYISQ